MLFCGRLILQRSINLVQIVSFNFASNPQLFVSVELVYFNVESLQWYEVYSSKYLFTEKNSGNIPRTQCTIARMLIARIA